MLSLMVTLITYQKKKFDVHSYYKAIRGTIVNSFLWKSIWCHLKKNKESGISCVKALKRVSFFLWTTNLVKKVKIGLESICFSIVMLFMFCGVKILRCLGFNG